MPVANIWSGSIFLVDRSRALHEDLLVGASSNLWLGTIFFGRTSSAESADENSPLLGPLGQLLQRGRSEEGRGRAQKWVSYDRTTVRP